MSKFCVKCGAQLPDGGKFCQFCGAETPQEQPSEQQSPWRQPPYQPPQNQPWQQNPYQQPYYAPPKERHITFIFVTALVFMIFFAVRSITALTSLGDWNSLRGGLRDMIYGRAMFSVFMTFITFAAALALFIFSAVARNKNKPAPEREKAAKTLFILSALAFVAGIVYMVSEALLLAAAFDYLSDAGKSQMYGSLVFDVVFICFGLVNIIKSNAFIGDMKRKAQENNVFPQ